MEKITIGGLSSILKKDMIIDIAIILVSIMLLGYVVFDIFYIKPTINTKVEQVTEEFMLLKVYLDTKIPQIDSALIVHTKQIEDQNKQLSELNKLTAVIKE